MITSDEELNNVKNTDTFNVGIDAAWAGGKFGCTSVTYSLIQLLPKILSPKGNCFIQFRGCKHCTTHMIYKVLLKLRGVIENHLCHIFIG